LISDWFQYTLDTGGEKKVDVEVTYWGDDGRKFDILANGIRIASEELKADHLASFFKNDIQFQRMCWRKPPMAE
jgi:hypothetical protein